MVLTFPKHPGLLLQLVWMYVYQQPLLGSLQGFWPYHIVPSFNFFPWPLRSWPFYCNWGCTFMHELFQLFSRDSSSASWCQDLVALHNFFKPSKTITIWVILTLPSLSSSMRYSFRPLCTTAYLCGPWGNTPGFMIFSDAGLFLTTSNFSVPANNQHQSSQ